MMNASPQAIRVPRKQFICVVEEIDDHDMTPWTPEDPDDSKVSYTTHWTDEDNQQQFQNFI